jgi:predicted permease
MDFRPYLRRHLPPLLLAREAEIVEELAQHLDEIYREARDAGLDHHDAYARAVAAVPEAEAADELASALREASRSSAGRVADRVLAALDEPGPSSSAPSSSTPSPWASAPWPSSSAHSPHEPSSAGAFPMPTSLFRSCRAAINPRLALRTLFRSPFVTIVAIVSLALGIGANAAVFSLFNQWLLQPLPVSEPDRLVNLSAPGPKPGSKSCGFAGNCEVVFSYPMFRDLERVQTPFTGLAAHRHFEANLTSNGQTVMADGMLVSGGYFSVLGLPAALGRLLGPDDDRTLGESPVVVLSHAYWQASFGSRPDVLGQTIVVNGRTMTIVGVAPRGFEGTTLGVKPQVFVPITMRWLVQPGRNPDNANRRSYWVYLFARLKPGLSLEQARAAIDAPYHAIVNDVEAPLQEMSDQTMARFKAKGIGVEPGSRGQSDVATAVRMPLTLLVGVTLLVLLIACVNIANLLLARAAARSSEMALRLSIGGSRGHLIAQLLTESSMLALFGGVASLLVARWTVALIGSLLPAEAMRLSLQLDASALIVTATLALGTSLLVGLFPALHATRPDVLSALKGQSGQPAGGRGAARFRTTLATAQIALSMVLLVLAGLFTKSLDNISRVNPGMNLDGLVTFEVSPARNAYTPDRAALLIERLEDELAALPGVTATASSQAALLSGRGWMDSVKVEGFEIGPDTDHDTNYDEIGPGYLHALGVPLIAGREFTRADSLKAAKVAIVNERFAEKFHLGRDAVGKRVSRSSSNVLDMEIVGLVKDARHTSLKGTIPPMFFIPHRQDARLLRSMTFYVRTSLNPEQIMAEIRQVVSRLDPNLPVEKLRTMPRQVRDETMVLDRFMGVLTMAFAVLATMLAAIGLYGVLAYTVAQRTREIGLRMALGATRVRVRQMVLRQVGLMTLVGGSIGLAAAVAVARAAQALLFDLQFHDTGVLAAAAVVLTLVALAAGFVPADRAARVDPMRALKYE